MPDVAYLKDLRKTAGKRQNDVAAALGISIRTVIRHEQGDTPLGFLHRQGYANLYGVPADTIEQPQADEVAA